MKTASHADWRKVIGHGDCNSLSTFYGPDTIANDDAAMRLLRWSSQNELSLTDDLDKNIPPYAILSHTWDSDHNNEVTFADIQKSQGQSKAGYAKI